LLPFYCKRKISCVSVAQNRWISVCITHNFRTISN